MKKQDIGEFVSFVKDDLSGDERGQAQTFCDRLFRAYGQKGIYEAQGKLEARIKIADTIERTILIIPPWTTRNEFKVLM